MDGLCCCGCGGKTTVATRNSTRGGMVKGVPQRFISGHNGHEVNPYPKESAAPFRIRGVYCRLIPLSRGLHAIVWESDYEWLMQWRWCALWNPEVRGHYAVRIECREGKQRTVYMHREVLGLKFGDPRKGDHAEPAETLNNSRTNLRIANDGQSTFNRRMPITNTSGYKGVSWDKHTRKWHAQIVVRGKNTSLGYFHDREIGYQAYCRAAATLHGEFARLA